MNQSFAKIVMQGSETFFHKFPGAHAAKERTRFAHVTDEYNKF